MTTFVHLKPLGKYGSRGQFWEASLADGTVIVPSSVDPGFAACRALKAMGIVGSMTTVVNGTRSMTIDIDKGAGLATTEGDSYSVRIAKWKPYDPSGKSTVESEEDV